MDPHELEIRRDLRVLVFVVDPNSEYKYSFVPCTKYVIPKSTPCPGLLILGARLPLGA